MLAKKCLFLSTDIWRKLDDSDEPHLWHIWVVRSRGTMPVYSVT